MFLNLGCGNTKRLGFVNIDSNPNYSPDRIMDLNKEWKIRSETVDYIFSKALVEHLDSYEHFLKEAHRVLKPGASVEFIVPHYSWPDAYFPTHKHYFSASFFLKGFNYHSGPDYSFKVERLEFVYSFNPVIQKVFGFFPNLNPVFWEKFIWKAPGIRVVLKKRVLNQK